MFIINSMEKRYQNQYVTGFHFCKYCMQSKEISQYDSLRQMAYFLLYVSLYNPKLYETILP